MKGEDIKANGCGMSRAAKKRAKKNKKKQLQQDASHNQTEPDIKRSKPNPEDDGVSDDDNMVKIVSREQKQDSKASVKKGGDNENGAAASDNENHQDEDMGDDGSEGFDDITPSFPDTPLLEILLRKESSDEAKAAVLNSLTAKQRAAALFQAILDPTPLDVFYDEYWEKKPLLVKARKENRNRYDGLLSLKSIKEMSKNHPLYYARDLNVTRYQKDSNGVKRRITLDKLPEDEKDAETGVLVKRSELWSNYDSGCTIRLLCPHKYNDAVHSLLSTLEGELQCMVGANAYLTPPNAAQGFAPHYDDIEAFCLQLEGSKRWKVYNPTLKLPRTSSEDFTVDDLKDMEPVMDVTLEQGDILYMPRGWIHQACTLKDNNEHSLHLTVSAMQQWAWCDLMDIVIPEAMENAVMSETSSSLRQGLPRGFLEYMGVMHDTSVDENVPDSIKKAGGNEDQELPSFERRKIQKQEKFKVEAKKRIMKIAMAVSTRTYHMRNVLGVFVCKIPYLMFLLTLFLTVFHCRHVT